MSEEEEKPKKKPKGYGTAFEDIFPEVPPKFRHALWDIVKTKDNLASLSRFWHKERLRWLISEEECKVLHAAGLMASPHMVKPPRYETVKLDNG
jgi:hypothetical protein